MIIETNLPLSLIPWLSIASTVTFGLIGTGAALLGAGLAAAGAGAYGASKAAGSASDARQSAQQTFNFAQQFRPNLYAPNYNQQQQIFQALMQQALQGQAQYNPTYYTKNQEKQASDTLIRREQQAAQPVRDQLVESQLRRGLFSSGIGAQQSREYEQQRGQNLNDALLNLQLQFTQQRANENARAFGLNQGAAQQRFGQLAGLGSFGQSQLGAQQDLYNTLLAYAGGQGAAASQQRIAANQALSSAIQGPANLLGTYGLLSAYGGLNQGQQGLTINPTYPQYAPPQPSYGYNPNVFSGY